MSVTLTQVSKTYGDTCAVEPTTLEIRSGEWPVARCVAELMLYVQRHLSVPLAAPAVPAAVEA